MICILHQVKTFVPCKKMIAVCTIYLILLPTYAFFFEKLHMHIFTYYPYTTRHVVAQLVEALRYKPEGQGFNSRWCHWNFSLT
jgi:hypothetical protein